MKNIKLTLASFILAFSVSSCLLDEDDTTAFEDTLYVVGFETAIANESYFADEGVVTANYPLNILGGSDGTPIKEDIVVTYSISNSSTAQEGKEFDFIDNSGSLTIPAGSTFVNFPLNINTGGFDPKVPTTLTLKIEDVQGAPSVISANNNSLTVTFVGCKSEVDQFTYLVTTVRSDGSLENQQIETITMLSVNEFRTETVGPFGPGARRGSIGGTEGLTFVDVCGTITIESQNLVNLYSNLVSGSGSVDPVTGDITLNYQFPLGANDTFYTSTFVKQ